jgi:hypothetical protein
MNYLEKLEETGNSLMIYKDGGLLFESNSKGIRPHLEAIEKYSDMLRDTIFVDKIVGRAAALLILYSRPLKVYATVISKSGKALFEESNLQYQFAKEVGNIKMRDGRIFCPFERMVQNISDPTEAYREILVKMADLKS